jgi:post-segregation antitoxin (ccd killing protein)
MAVDTVKRNARQRAWLHENMDVMQFTAQKGTRERLAEAAKARGVSLSRYLQIALDMLLVEDGYEPILKPAETEKDPE